MMQNTRRQRLRLWMAPISLAALAWVVYQLWGAWPQLVIDLPRLRVRWLWLPLTGTALCGYLAFEAFRSMFERACPALYGRMPLAHLYFVAQLMKHLPGRVWGLAYQSALGHRASLVQWASVSMAYMLLTTMVALWVATTVVVCLYGADWGGLAFVAGIVAYFGVWHPIVVNRLIGLLRRARFHACLRFADALQPFAEAGAGFKWRVLLWFSASWLVYLLAWGGYGLAWPGLMFADGVYLCALYTVAWFVGYISLISPSGIGVREMVFVLLAQRFPPDAVAGMAVLGRVMLLLVDVLLGILFAPFRSSLQKG